MVEIVDELKAKLVEIDGNIELLRRQIGDLEDQRDAFVKVIKVYDSEFTLVSAAPVGLVQHNGKRRAAVLPRF